MKKILLVEDDNNLREIYGARLLAEGYDIVSAKDGEEALSMAVAEKPDLIISDIMMPKISGFDMLDILRATPQTKETKVIMMTALSQAEDRERGERLGADRYLVKSQVTLEDVVKVVSEVIGVVPESAPAPQAAAPSPTPAPAATPPPEPVAAQPVPPSPTPAPAATPPPAPAPEPTATPAAPAMTPPVPTPPTPATPASPVSQIMPTPPTTAADEASTDAGVRKPKVIAPISDPAASGPDLNQLLAAEMAKEQGSVIAPATPPPAPQQAPTATAPVPAPQPSPSTTADEQAIASMLSSAAPASEADEKKLVSDQIQDFVNSAGSPDDNPPAPTS